ncbi:MAG: hypothetical protein Ct9H90mP16_20430 [Candidatus Poseidoniales archaeon]|nr:MAG: hypothetical protein Ct9H90mP16_20430 [Candidatus Poseidoniales archaeon]
MTVGVDRRAMLIALVGAAVISFSPVFYVYSNTNPSTGAFFRMLYALPILGLFAFRIRNQIPALHKHDGWHLVQD